MSGTLTEDRGHSEFVESMRLMTQCAQEMKEVPELPSEKPQDVQRLTKVEFPQDGGVLTYMDGKEYPYQGYPFYELVGQIDLIKKVGRATFSGLYHALNRKKIRWLLLPFSAWLLKELVYVEVYVFWRLVDRFKLKPFRYCKAIRELYRAMSIGYRGEKEEERELRKQLRDLVCMIIEFDNAYRFRFQDWAAELNKESFKNNPGKEIVRILEIAQSRENQQEISDTWKLIKIFTPILIRADRKLSSILSHTIENLNVDEVKLNEIDRYWADPRKDYRFGFQNTL